MLLRELARRAGARLGPAAIGAGAVAIGGPIGVAACKDKDKEKTVTPSFDPEALERGAKALREINASPHAKNVRSHPVRATDRRNDRPIDLGIGRRSESSASVVPIDPFDRSVVRSFLPSALPPSIDARSLEPYP